MENLKNIFNGMKTSFIDFDLTQWQKTRVVIKKNSFIRQHEINKFTIDDDSITVCWAPVCVSAGEDASRGRTEWDTERLWNWSVWTSV